MYKKKRNNDGLVVKTMQDSHSLKPGLIPSNNESSAIADMSA